MNGQDAERLAGVLECHRWCTSISWAKVYHEDTQLLYVIEKEKKPLRRNRNNGLNR
jgi:hypothetical protein